jgi:homoserine kinase
VFSATPVRVAVPATSANLGPGFDALGLALDLEDELTAQITETGLRVEVTGEGAGEVPSGELTGDDQHLVVAALLAALKRMGVPRPPGLELTCHNRIPHARGLGSSSAAIIAGIVLARGLAPEAAAALDDEAALRLAAEIEGHPDNVAACLLGGLTIAWTGHTGVRAVRLTPAPGVRPMVFIPEARGITAEARAALPATVPHPDAAFNAARAALLVHALTSDPALLLEATADRLHQPYRAPAMPASAALVDRLRAAGVPAVVSGAGPSVLALPAAGDISALAEAPMGWCARSLSVSLDGARILVSRHAEGDPVAAGPPS